MEAIPRCASVSLLVLFRFIFGQQVGLSLAGRASEHRGNHAKQCLGQEPIHDEGSPRSSAGVVAKTRMVKKYQRQSKIKRKSEVALRKLFLNQPMSGLPYCAVEAEGVHENGIDACCLWAARVQRSCWGGRARSPDRSCRSPDPPWWQTNRI